MLIDYDNFRKSKLNSSPFEWMVVENFIKSEYLGKVSEDFPNINAGGSFPLSNLEYKDNFAAFILELQGAKFKQCVEEKFNISLKDVPIMITARGMCKEHNGQIHIDSKGKILTFLIYFNKSWTSEGGKLRLLNNKHNIEDYFAEVTPNLGTLVAFRCTENAWHGHKPFVGIRRSIQLNWVQSNEYLVKEQRRHKISAFFKKLVGCRND